MKLSVNYSEKRGLPRFGSHGASCSIEIESLQEALPPQPADLRMQLRALYATCRQAVRDELQTASGDPYGIAASTAPDVPRATAVREAVRDGLRFATASQIRVLQSLAQRGGLDLAAESERRFQQSELTALTVQQASQLIDQLKLSRVG